MAAVIVRLIRLRRKWLSMSSSGCRSSRLGFVPARGGRKVISVCHDRLLPTYRGAIRSRVFGTSSCGHCAVYHETIRVCDKDEEQISWLVGEGWMAQSDRKDHCARS